MCQVNTMFTNDEALDYSMDLYFFILFPKKICKFLLLLIEFILLLMFVGSGELLDDVRRHGSHDIH